MNAHAAAPPPLMPYGAPELKSAGRRLLVRAVITGSAAWSALFLIALGLSVMFLRVSPPREPAVPQIYIDPPPPSDAPRHYAPEAPRTPIRPVAPKSGEFKPAEDAKVPDEVTVPNEPQGPPGPPTPPGDPSPIQPGIAPFVPDTLPGPNDVVYVEELPVEMRCPQPPYPSLAYEAGVEGTVLVRALIGKDGHVKDVFVAPKYSIPLLDRAALDAVRTCVYRPAMSNNHPVAVWIAVPVRFTLHH